jgi:hypothetical protein
MPTRRHPQRSRRPRTARPRRPRAARPRRPRAARPRRPRAARPRRHEPHDHGAHRTARPRRLPRDHSAHGLHEHDARELHAPPPAHRPKISTPTPTRLAPHSSLRCEWEGKGTAHSTADILANERMFRMKENSAPIPGPSGWHDVPVNMYRLSSATQKQPSVAEDSRR